MKLNKVIAIPAVALAAELCSPVPLSCCASAVHS